MKVVLEIDKGPQQGTRFELTLNGYRSVGREDVQVVTTQIATTGDVQLDPDDIARVEAHLEKRGSSHAGGPHSLRIGTFKRGRDILLDDEKISRKHAMFFFDGHGPSIVDLLSTNGTYVNGTRVTDSDLADGDIVNVGKTRFVVRVSPNE